MKNQELIERYIYAVTKNLPAKIRQDVADELNSLVSDMLEERCGDLLPTEHDVRVVLSELGTPGDLAQKYRTDSKNCLIGPPYYGKYLLVLKIVLACVVFGMTVAAVITTILGGGVSVYQFIGQWLGMIFNGLIFAFAIVTFIFAVFYHKGIEIDAMPDSLNDLPPVPKNNEKISKGEAIAGIVFSVIFAVVLLAAPQIIAVTFGDGKFVTVFAEEIIKNTWYIIIALTIIGIAKESMKLIEGRYSRRLLIATVIANLLTAVLSIYWLVDNQIINPDFITGINGLIIGDAGFIRYVFVNCQYFILGVILLALILNTVTTALRTIKSK